MDTIKVMTYNIHSGVGTDGKADWKRIADIIKEKDPDFLGLQEVCRFRPTNPTDLPKVLKEYLDLDLYFGESMTVQDLWHYGNAAGTKLKAELLDVVHFDIPEGEEPRVFLILKSCIAGREFYFCTCHVPFEGEMENDTQIRVNCFKKLTQYIKDHHYYPAILTGDFNSYPGTAPIEYLHEEWDVANDLDPVTPTAYCSMGAGWRQIDFICTYPKGAFEVKKLTFVENLLASDHRPVVAELLYKNA